MAPHTPTAAQMERNRRDRIALRVLAKPISYAEKVAAVTTATGCSRRQAQVALRRVRAECEEIYANARPAMFMEAVAGIHATIAQGQEIMRRSLAAVRRESDLQDLGAMREAVKAWGVGAAQTTNAQRLLYHRLLNLRAEPEPGGLILDAQSGIPEPSEEAPAFAPRRRLSSIDGGRE